MQTGFNLNSVNLKKWAVVVGAASLVAAVYVVYKNLKNKSKESS